MTSTHRHIASNADADTARPFAGPAPGARREVPAAHGGCSYRRVCKCGAVQIVNASGGHTERGAWIAADA